METGNKLQVLTPEEQAREHAEQWERLFEEVISPEMDRTGRGVYDVAKDNGVSPPDGWGLVYDAPSAEAALSGSVADKSDQVLYCGDCCLPLSECGHR